MAAFSAALVVLLGLGATGWFFWQSDVTCLGRTQELRVAAAPEIAPVLTELGAEFAADRDCQEVTVESVESSDVAYDITGEGPTTGGADNPSVWIPDSSLWEDHVVDTAGPNALESTSTMIANSPIVLASPPGSDHEESSWASLVPDTAPRDDDQRAVHLVEPTLSSSGLTTLALIYGAIEERRDTEDGEAADDAPAPEDQEEGDDEQEGEDESGDSADEDAPEEPEEGDESDSAARTSPEFIAALQTLQRDVAINPRDALERIAAEDADSGAVLAVSEQAVWAHNAEEPDQAVQVLYPTEGTYTLDYPYLLLDVADETAALAEDFRGFLRDEATQSQIRDRGFRSTDGTANEGLVSSDGGFAEEAPTPLASPRDGAAEDLIAAWNQLQLGTRMLAVYDVSGSMLAEVPEVEATRMEVVLAASSEGLQLFEDDAEIGVWEFSTDLEEDIHHREVVPLRELGSDGDDGTHREGLMEELGDITPNPRGDTALYETVLAAHREMRESYAPDRNNVVLLFTDGEQDNPDGDLELEELLATLEEESDPDRPIPFIILNYGASIDTEPMEQVAELTGGESFVTSDPEEIGEIFLRGFALRLGSDE
ncbi:VWA domain-containing protein [Spiractinospora alimapuensis]|uniref:substrate-binding and VWA domain-containing protein n=1 Tax=Spiractinospora alimapuensis TaxID=2820884 RepID=UPI001F1F11EE|nr:substrate-binding and VWA domain-containing protein [Spiractinospora alimapuensis]QVQ53742.1 VWA domain-containing protein [Spiractinospora alimapuensis]